MNPPVVVEDVQVPLTCTADAELSTMVSSARVGVASGSALKSTATATVSRRQHARTERQDMSRLESLPTLAERIRSPGVTDRSLFASAATQSIPWKTFQTLSS